MEPQVEVDSEDEDAYEQEQRERERRVRDREPREARDSRDAHDRKQRSSRKNRSPERFREEPPRPVQRSYTYTLNNDDGGPTRTKLARSYTRPLDEAELYDRYGSAARYVERPSLGVREASYNSSYGATPMNKFPKVKTTKLDDVQYSKYPTYAA